MSSTVRTAAEIHPFQTEVREEKVAELRGRIAAARWPSKELVEIGRRACSWQRCRRSRATGAPSTTSGGSRRG